MKKKSIISLDLNLLVVAMVIVAYIMGKYNLKFIEDNAENIGNRLLIYFTVQSNLFAAAVAIVMAVAQILYLKGKIAKLPKWLYVVKFVSVIGVMITMLTVVGYLAPLYGFDKMFLNSNLFFHLLAPLTTFISFVFFERSDRINFADIFFGMIHFVVYGVVYMIVAFSHEENGVIPFEYNWYGLAAADVTITVFTSLIMTVFAFSVCILTWLLNRQKNVKVRQ